MTSALKKDEAQRLRDALVEMSGAGYGETAPDRVLMKQFLPLADHARIFETESFLIIGPRGAGKTHLFRAVQSVDGIQALAAVGRRLDAQQVRQTKWYVGYSGSGTEFPAEMLFRQFSQGHQPADLQVVWLGLLLRVLVRQGQMDVAQVAPALRSVLESPSNAIPKLFDCLQANLHEAVTLLDAYDASLLQVNGTAFVIYDELDRVSSSDWEQLATILRGLIQFWSSNARRWRRLRPKIFLRKDLFERAALVGPDVSKISAQRLELSWTVRDLFALFAKRFVNQAPETVRQYLGKTLPDGDDRGALGWFPTNARTDDYRPMVERICGELMGASPSKGYAFSWIPTHLQDAFGQVWPRSFLRLFEKAGQLESESPKADWPRLLHHSSLRGALDRVSLDRMEEFKEELPWIEHVRTALVDARLSVPIERATLERALESIDWSNRPDRPPLHSGYELVQFLGELGILYLRPDERVDVRDIYLNGLGFRRKGGVKKPF